MAEAWIVRGNQQQEFVREMLDDIFDESEKEGRSYRIYMISMALAILRNLKALWEGRSCIPEDEREEFFLNNLWTRIVQFSRVDSEVEYLLWCLLQKVLENVGSQAQMNYARDQMMNPQAVFHAESAMTEVRE